MNIIALHVSVYFEVNKEPNKNGRSRIWPTNLTLRTPLFSCWYLYKQRCFDYSHFSLFLLLLTIFVPVVCVGSQWCNFQINTVFFSTYGDGNLLPTFFRLNHFSSMKNSLQRLCSRVHFLYRIRHISLWFNEVWPYASLNNNGLRRIPYENASRTGLLHLCIMPDLCMRYKMLWVIIIFF